MNDIGLQVARWLPNGFTILSSAPFEKWYEEFERIQATEKAMPWVVGDVLNAGEDRYEEFSQAVDIKYATQHIEKMRVARRFPLERRREAFSWSFHRELAALEPADQDRWLDRAEAEGWDTVADLKRRMKAPPTNPSTYPRNAPPDDDEPIPPRGGGDAIAPAAYEAGAEDDSTEDIRAIIEQVRELAPRLAAGTSTKRAITEIEGKICGALDALWSTPGPLSSTDKALACRPAGWRVEITETDNGWTAALRKSGAQIAIGISPHLPSAICEAMLAARLGSMARAIPSRSE